MPEPGTGPDKAHLRLMVAFALSDARGRSVAIASRRGRGLLAYLVLAPETSASRERLSGLFWSDRGDAQARASLRQCLLELRNALAAADLALIDVGRETISLAKGALDSDIAELERGLAGENADALIAAVSGVGAGRLLEDLDIGGLFNDWLEQTRARLDQAIAAGVLRHLARLEAFADWPRVRALASAFLQRDPLDETIVATAIRADVALGATSAAHRRFQVLEAALAKEFGAAPGTATREALVASAKPTPRVEGSTSAHATPAGPGAPPLVVVAAFESFGAGEVETRLAATLRDEVLSGLSRFRDLRVITDARPVDLVVADDANSVADAYALGGTIRDGAGEQRFIVQLLRRGERRIVWSDRFALSKLNALGTIDDIVAQVVGAILPTIHADLMTGSHQRPTDRSYQAYLSARAAAANVRSFEEARAVAGQLEAMVAREPSFALPYLPLAYLYNTDFGYTRAGSSGPQEKARAFELARKALNLDRGHVHGYTVAGWCHLRRRQWKPARTYLEQALSLNPFHAMRVMEVAFGMIFLGELDRARALLDRCLLLNPTPDDEFFRDLGLLELLRGNHELAASYFELTARPTIWGVIYAAMNAEMGGTGSAASAEEALSLIASIWPPESTMTADLVLAWIASHHPFQIGVLEDRFVAAARQMLERT